MPPSGGGTEITMEINQEMLDSLLALSDEELRGKLLLIAGAIGFDGRIAAAQTANVPKIRTMLKNAGAEDVSRLINSMGAERADLILKTLGGDGT